MSASDRPPFVIEPTEEELKKGEIVLSFNSRNNTYVRSGQKVYGWRSLVSHRQNIEFLDFLDFPKRYIALARSPERARHPGKITSIFDLENHPVVASEMLVMAQSHLVNESSVEVVVRADGGVVARQNRSAADDVGGEIGFSVDVEGHVVIEVEFELMGGAGPDAWMDALLFRAGFDKDTQQTPDQLTIVLKFKALDDVMQPKTEATQVETTGSNASPSSEESSPGSDTAIPEFYSESSPTSVGSDSDTM